MLLGIAWMFDGIPEDIAPVCSATRFTWKREIAELSVRIHR